MALDVTSLITKALLTSGTVNKVATETKTTKQETTDVLTEALPTLLTALSGAKSESTVSKLTELFETDPEEEEVEEAKDSAILTALLGKSGIGKMVTSVAGDLKLDSDVVSKILAYAAPVILEKIMAFVNTAASAKTSTKKATTTNKTTTKKNDDTAEIVTDLAKSLLGAALKSKK